MIDQHPVRELRGRFQINCGIGLGGGGGSVTKNLPSSVLKRGILATFKVGVHPYLNDILKGLKKG